MWTHGVRDTEVLRILRMTLSFWLALLDGWRCFSLRYKKRRLSLKGKSWDSGI